MVSLFNINAGHSDLQKIVSICYDSDGTPDLNVLWSKKHFSAFEHIQLIFYIECPIFVARQLFRYRTATFTEKSLRHSTIDDLKSPFGADVQIEEHYRHTIELYQALVDSGVKKEKARQLLPLSTNTKFYMRLDMRNLYHLLEERLSIYAQPETRQIAEELLACVPEWIKNIYNFNGA